MQIRLEKIGAEPFQWQEEVTVPAASLERPELIDLGEISWAGRIWIESPGFRLEGSLSYQQTVACDRCLAPVVQEIHSDVRLLVMVGAPEPAPSELELSAEDLEVVHLTSELLDTDPVVLEQVQLNLPMRTVCKDDCRGLCPRCGVNRNLEECTCPQAAFDPRWQVLQGLKD